MSMICDNCGKRTATVRSTTHVYGAGRASFLVEEIPLVACRSCHEHYFTAATLKELERIKRNWRKLTVKRSIRVARFGGAA